MAYSYDYSTSSDDYNNDDYDESDEDFLVDCPHCPNPVKRSNYDAHMEKVHTCDECGNQMPKEALKGHKDRKHMEICLTCGKQMLATLMKQHIKTHNQQCKHCKLSFPQQTLEKHIQDKHPFHSTLGMICLDKITDAEFNKLVAANRIYSKDGHLFKRL
ncbi:zinc finger protein 382-like [Sitodiplosis mosellana]|uniref:zinc finger protein 382-like n=1 Tax=Sitodiplosis mosellana TaxID=263140 RepID=UPI0024447875|nr:zinc finger protein 382-like [Sitodiplosis mosellana]